MGVHHQIQVRWDSREAYSEIGGQRFHTNLWHRLFGDFCSCGKAKYCKNTLVTCSNLRLASTTIGHQECFLEWRFEEEVYMHPPSGFEQGFGSKVCRLKKSLYSLKQSPRTWFEKFTRCKKARV